MSQQVACVFGNSDGSPRTSASFQISRVCPRANGVFASEGAKKVVSVCRLCMHSHQNERRGMVSCCGDRFPLSLLFCLRANHQPPSPCDHSRVKLAWEHPKDVQHYVLLYHQHQPASDLSCSPYVPFRLPAPLPLLPLRHHEMATTRLTYVTYMYLTSPPPPACTHQHQHQHRRRLGQRVRCGLIRPGWSTAPWSYTGRAPGAYWFRLPRVLARPSSSHTFPRCTHYMIPRHVYKC